MKAIKTIISLLMVLSLLFSFAACGKGGEDNKTTTEESQPDVVNVDVTAEEDETTTESETTTTTKESITTTTTKVNTTTTTKPIPKPKLELKTYNTISEILDFYKSAANPLKSSPTAVVTRTKEVLTAISGEIPLLYRAGFKEGEKTEQVKAGANQKESILKRFTVENQSFVCDLTEDDVESATCTRSGEVYTVTINVKDDDEGTYSRSKKCVSTVQIPVGTWTCKGVKIIATIKDDKLLTLYYDMPTYGTLLADSFAFSLEQWWTVDSY